MLPALFRTNSILGNTLKRCSPFLHYTYLAAILVKGLDGAIETVAGLTIAIAGSHRLFLFVIEATAPELEIHLEQCGGPSRAPRLRRPHPAIEFLRRVLSARPRNSQNCPSQSDARIALDISRRDPHTRRVHCLHELSPGPALVGMVAGICLDRSGDGGALVVNEMAKPPSVVDTMQSACRFS